MTAEHLYSLELIWTGNTGAGTTSYRGYSRDHEIRAEGPPTLLGTADPVFRGVSERWNPEQLFIASLAQCHLLTYLWLAVGAKVEVVAYTDTPSAELRTHPDGSGELAWVKLAPRVSIGADSDPDLAAELHHRVGDYCFIARSVKVPLLHEPVVEVVPRAE